MSDRLPVLPAHVEEISPLTVVPFEGADWYDLAGEDHPWMRWRFAEAHALLHRVGADLASPDRALDVGGGIGVVRRQFEAATPWTVDLAEVDLTALRNGAEGRGRTMHYDVLERRAEFGEAYGTVLLFDVLEHIEDTTPFLEALRWHLRPGGRLLVNVPALPVAHSRYDDAAGHIRRYTRRSLVAEVPDGMVVEQVRAWGTGLVPVLLARKAWLEATARGQSREDVLRAGFKAPGPLGSGVLAAMVRSEALLRGRAPVGSSLLLSARRVA